MGKVTIISPTQSALDGADHSWQCIQMETMGKWQKDGNNYYLNSYHALLRVMCVYGKTTKFFHSL